MTHGFVFTTVQVQPVPAFTVKLFVAALLPWLLLPGASEYVQAACADTRPSAASTRPNHHFASNDLLMFRFLLVSKGHAGERHGRTAR